MIVIGWQTCLPSTLVLKNPSRQAHLKPVKLFVHKLLSPHMLGMLPHQSTWSYGVVLTGTIEGMSWSADVLFFNVDSVLGLIKAGRCVVT